jgi:hypothetical protein
MKKIIAYRLFIRHITHTHTHTKCKIDDVQNMKLQKSVSQIRFFTDMHLVVCICKNVHKTYRRVCGELYVITFVTVAVF